MQTSSASKPADHLYSVVIPVYNSAPIVATTTRRVVEFFRREGLRLELILVNDGSKDSSWEEIKRSAQAFDEVQAINLLKNYGQHNANLCGFQRASGDFVVTMDDDLQNPPEEIARLIEKSVEGYDLVIGEFASKQHALYRRIGSKLIAKVNREIFGTPDGIVLSNFRLVSRAVVDRVCDYKTAYPYIPGLVIWFSHSIANVTVEHHERSVGKSNYNLAKIVRLVATILFSYSSYPLRLFSTLGLFFSFATLLLGGYYFFSALFSGVTVPGWATIVVLLSVFNAFLIAILSMMGEYLVRIINQTSYSESYIVKEVVE